MILCQSGKTWFHVNRLDGLEIRKLTDFSPGENDQIGDWSWSPDGKVVLMIVAGRNCRNADLYRFDVEMMLKDPRMLPVQLTGDEAFKYGIVWQPVPRWAIRFSPHPGLIPLK